MVVFVWGMLSIVAVQSMANGNNREYNNISISKRKGETNVFFK